MNPDDATGLLNAERYLLFHDLQAGPEFDGVILTVDAAEVTQTQTSAQTGDAEIDRILGPVRAIESAPGSLRYTICFAPCIAYTWRNESFVLPEKDEDFSLRLRRYGASSYLDFVRSSTFAEEAAGYPLEHFAVITLDAVIDIVCRDVPTVTAHMLDPDDPGTLPGLPSDHT